MVSGLPRSGTSMMMRMLEAAPWPILSDGARSPDESNPHGYYEFEPVKSMHEAAEMAWLQDAQGKAVKIVSFLLAWLPERYDYRVIFMRRDLREVVASQQKMLASTDESERGRLTGVYSQHLEEVSRLMRKRSCFSTLDVEHRDVLTNPRDQAARVAGFLGRGLDIDRMTAAVDPHLHRHRI